MQIKDYQTVLTGIIIATGITISTLILSNSIVEVQKIQNQTVKVTGSASTNVTSDRASWFITVKNISPTLKEGYTKTVKDTETVKNFLISNGINEKDIDIKSVNNYENYKRFPNGNTSNEIESYNVYRNIEVKSNDINKLTDISKNTDELINKNINLSAENVQYFVSDLDKIKIETIKKASENAKERAQSMVEGTNGKIGVLVSAKTGVFQIVPMDSTAVDDYGINDTTSIEKKVTATVSATFTVK